MKQDIKNLLVSLSDNMERLVAINVDRKKFWCWDYYAEIEKGIRDKELKRKIYQQIYHLERFGYINKRGFTIKGLTGVIKSKGRMRKSGKWDKKWRVVIFDIPEKNKKLRNYFREVLVGLGFEKLQNSVWISPYDYFKEIQEVIKLYGIAQYVVLMVVDSISNELLFKKKFKL